LEQSSNDPDDLYVAIEDAHGRTGVVVHPDPLAVLASEWTEWVIYYEEFSGGGLGIVNPEFPSGPDFGAVKKMFIGVGDPSRRRPRQIEPQMAVGPAADTSAKGMLIADAFVATGPNVRVLTGYVHLGHPEGPPVSGAKVTLSNDNGPDPCGTYWCHTLGDPVAGYYTAIVNECPGRYEILAEKQSVGRSASGLLAPHLENILESMNIDLIPD
jgi:hypothetical protein